MLATSGLLAIQSQDRRKSEASRTDLVTGLPNRRVFDEALNRESAKEILKARAEAKMKKVAEQEAAEKAAKENAAAQKKAAAERRRSDSATDVLLKSLARSLGSQGGKVLRGVLGSILGGK